MTNKMLPTICVYFDGVIHYYVTSGWQGADKAKDPPVDGAIEWLREATNHFTVAICSSRSSQSGGIQCMKDYILNHAMSLGEDVSWTSLLQYPIDKPSALFTIDDRAWQFNGQFPTIEYIKEFQPWNKRPKEFPAIVDGNVVPAKISLPMTSEQLFTAISTTMCNQFAGNHSVPMADILRVTALVTRKFFPNI